MVLLTQQTIIFIEIVASCLLHYIIFGKMSVIATDLDNSNSTNESKRRFNFQEVIQMNQKYSRLSDQCALRIYGGQQAAKGTIPYQVALRKGIQRGRRWIVFCGGAIITERHIVTASHCMDHVRLRQVRVIAGTLQASVLLKGRTKKERLESLSVLQLTETWRKIAACYGHARYNRNKIINDFAILEIERAFVFSTTIQPILILTRKMEEQLKIPDETLCLVSGYGLMENRQHSPTLRKVCVPTVSYRTCSRLYRLHSNNTQICAGSKGKDSCQGDSGGPMACKGVLIGIVSFGGACGTAPGVYTRLTGYTGGQKFKFIFCSSNKINCNIRGTFMLLVLLHMYEYYILSDFISL